MTQCISPDAKVIVFPTPTPVIVWEPVHFTKLVLGQSSDSTKVAFVTQSVEKINNYEKEVSYLKDIPGL